MEDQQPQPTEEELKKAYDALMKRRAYSANYMKKFRQEHKEEWNAQARQLYAKRKAKKQAQLQEQTQDATITTTNNELQ